MPIAGPDIAERMCRFAIVLKDTEWSCLYYERKNMFQTIIVYGVIWTVLNGMIAIGFSLLFGVAGVLNLTHGMLIMSACYAAFLFATEVNLPATVCLFLATIVTACLITSIYFGLLKRFLTAQHTTMILVTAGMAMVIQQCIILTVGPHTKFVPSIIKGSTSVLGVVVSSQGILSVCIALCSVGVLGIFLQRTKLGRAIRAVSQDREIASISGINSEQIYGITVIIAGILAGMAGILVAPIQTVTPEMGWEMMVKAFTVTILAGLGGPIWGY